MPLIVLDGIDGCGKSTQLRLLTERLRARGVEPLCLREPGGTALGERVREILLDPATVACPVAELLAYQVARAQLVDQVLRPALSAGRTVLLDRFWYATVAYQAYGLGLDERTVRAAIAVAVGELRVDRAIYLRVPVALGAARRAAARNQPDRIEARGLAYLEKVASGYAALVASGEMIAVDGERPVEVVADDLWRLIQPTLD
jgi:dTMP kinase